MFLVMLVGLLLLVSKTGRQTDKFARAEGDCIVEDGSPQPMSSRGFARSCCDVFPAQFGKYRPSTSNAPSTLDHVWRIIAPWRFKRSFFEAGVHDDPRYFVLRELKHNDVVYVVTPDLSTFVKMFLKLPASARITLITGSEDIGAPWEIFHPNRTGYFDYNMAALWPEGQPVSMRDFILDPRLVKWYAQNYDLVGCNYYTCSTVSRESDFSIVQKVEPLPIGLDLHSLSEKQRGATPRFIASQICAQRQDLATARSADSSFQHRRLTVHAEFDCVFQSPKGQELRIRTRGPLCALLLQYRGDPRFSYTSRSEGVTAGRKNSTDRKVENMKIKKPAVLSSRESKIEFWKGVSACAFSLAPPGFGVDTHRVWEILQMRTVPIVLSSTLDPLYRQFPIVIVRSWDQVFAAGALERFKKEIEMKHGVEPFTDQILHKLSAKFWVERVRNPNNSFL